MDSECLGIVLNKEVIAVNQDPRVSRGALVYSWPGNYTPASPATFSSPPVPASAAAPSPISSLVMATCNASDSDQRFFLNVSTGLLAVLSSGATQGACVTYGGYVESNVYLGACVGWVDNSVGGQVWTANATAGEPANTSFYVAGSGLMGLAVNKSAAAPTCGTSPAGLVQVGPPPPGSACAGTHLMATPPPASQALRRPRRRSAASRVATAAPAARRRRCGGLTRQPLRRWARYYKAQQSRVRSA